MSENGNKKSNIKISQKKKINNIAPSNVPRLDIQIIDNSSVNDTITVPQLQQLLSESYDEIKYIRNELAEVRDILLFKMDKIYEQLHVSTETENELAMIDDKKLKNQVAVDFLNDILISINRNKINFVREFRDVSKDDLLSDSCIKALNKNIVMLVKTFGKTNLSYARRNVVENYILIVLKKMIDMCGFRLVSYYKKVVDQYGNNCCKTTYSVQ